MMKKIAECFIFLFMGVSSISIVAPAQEKIEIEADADKEVKSRFLFPSNLEKIKGRNKLIYDSLKASCHHLLAAPSNVEKNIINTAIIQYLPRHTLSNDPLIQEKLKSFKSCSKFKESYKICCQAIQEYYEDPSTRDTVSFLAEGIEDLILKATEYKRNKMRKDLPSDDICLNQNEQIEIASGQNGFSILQRFISYLLEE